MSDKPPRQPPSIRRCRWQWYRIEICCRKFGFECPPLAWWQLWVIRNVIGWEIEKRN